MSPETLRTLGEWLVFVTALPQTVFVLAYGLRSPWWESTLGRALFTKSLGLTISLDLIAAFYLLGDYPWRPYMAIIGFAIITLGSWWQLIAFTMIRFRPAQPTPEATAGERDHV